jgi:hypothetical protein
MLIGIAVVCVAVPGAFAATSVVTLLVEDDGTVNANTIGEFTGGDSDPNSLARLSTGSYVYFEADDAANDADAIIMFDPLGVGAARFSVLASEASLSATDAALATPENMQCDDICVDPDTDDIYALMQNSAVNPTEVFVVRIPSLGFGTDTFGPVELAAANAVMGNRNGAGSITVDTLPSPNELVILHDSQVSGNDTTTNVLYTRQVTANPASANTVVATYSQLGFGTTPPWQAGDLVGFADLAVLGTGDYVLVNPFGDTTPGGGAGSTDGDIVRWNVGTASAELWREGDLVASRSPIVSLDDGGIAMWRVDDDDDIIRFDGNGNVVHTIAVSSELTAVVSNSPSGLDEIGNGFATDGDLTFAIFHNLDNESIIEIVDTIAPIELSTFGTE